MPDSRRLAVLKNLRDTVAGITIVNGYATNVKKVTLDWLNLTTEAVTPACCFDGFEPLDARTYQSGGAAMRGLVTEHVRIRLMARIDVPGTDPDRKQTAFENFVADVERAMVLDIARGGYALDTKLESPSQVMMGLDDKDWVLIEQPMIIRLQPRPYGSP